MPQNARRLRISSGHSRRGRRETENGDPENGLMSIFQAKGGKWTFVEAKQVGGE